MKPDAAAQQLTNWTKATSFRSGIEENPYRDPLSRCQVMTEPSQA
jgi:hypothetical protein